MAVGSGSDTQPTRLTQDQAAQVFEGLLSRDEEKQQAPETPAEEQETTEEVDPPEATEEDGEQPDSEEQPAESDEELDEQPDTPRKFKVKVADEELEVDEPELLKGYSRTADYTRKTQALAEERKTFQSEQQAVRDERQRYAAGLVQIEDALKAAVPTEPNWDELAKDPAAYTETRKAWDEYQKQLQAVKAEKDKALEKVSADQATYFRETLDREKSALVEKIPEWSDDATAKKETGELREFAKGLGYSDAEVDGVYDHRLILLLRKAMLHERAEKAKPKVRETIERVKTATPGPTKAATPKKVTAETRAKQRLAKTGRIEDAAAAFELMSD